jgi:ribosomal protein S3
MRKGKKRKFIYSRAHKENSDLLLSVKQIFKWWFEDEGTSARLYGISYIGAQTEANGTLTVHVYLSHCGVFVGKRGANIRAVTEKLINRLDGNVEIVLHEYDPLRGPVKLIPIGVYYG